MQECRRQGPPSLIPVSSNMEQTCRWSEVSESRSFKFVFTCFRLNFSTTFRCFSSSPGGLIRSNRACGTSAAPRSADAVHVRRRFRRVRLNACRAITIFQIHATPFRRIIGERSVVALFGRTELATRNGGVGNRLFRGGVAFSQCSGPADDDAGAMGAWRPVGSCPRPLLHGFARRTHFSSAFTASFLHRRGTPSDRQPADAAISMGPGVPAVLGEAELAQPVRIDRLSAASCSRRRQRSPAPAEAAACPGREILHAFDRFPVQPVHHPVDPLHRDRNSEIAAGRCRACFRDWRCAPSRCAGASRAPCGSSWSAAARRSQAGGRRLRRLRGSRPRPDAPRGSLR